tara:strand:- start:3193 stop:3726 length:534 start_codon:yes stop_codon:yes gene_type:complete
MPTLGEGKIKFGRSYVYLNPQINGQYSSVGVWRLTNQDISSGVDTSDLVLSAPVESGSPTINIGQPLYINSSGNAELADASALSTARVVGLATVSAAADDIVSFTRNQSLTIPNVNIIVDNVTDGLIVPGEYYWLSTNTGKLTRTPDSTTTGSVLLQVGLGVTTSELQIEIQAPVVI